MDSQIAAGYRKLVLALFWEKESENLLPLRECDIETIQTIMRYLDQEFPDRSYREILTMRFDLDGKGIQTLRGIGKQYGVSPERIRQKQVKALRLLRHPRRGWRLGLLFRTTLEDRLENLLAENQELKRDLAEERKHRMSEQMKARFGDVSPDKISIEQLEASVRLHNCLHNNGIDTLGQVLLKTEPDILLMKNFGRRTLNELKEILNEYGLSLARGK